VAQPDFVPPVIQVSKRYPERERREEQPPASEEKEKNREKTTIFDERTHPARLQSSASAPSGA